MAAVGKITLDIKEYEELLARARGDMKKFSSGAQNDFKQVGKGATKAGSLISSMSAEAGGAFGKLGNIIGAIASGPVVALTAALGALVAAGVDMWDRMTFSTEEYAKKLDLAAQAAEKNRAAVEKQVAEDQGYMERLQELASREVRSNEAKAEAATLIKNLTSRYGDLGISIDEVTGKITGMDEAQKKFQERQKQHRMQALQEQMTYTQSKLMNQGKQATSSMYFADRWLGGSKDAQKVTKNILSDPNLDIGKKLEYATQVRDYAKTDESIEKWQKVIDSLEKMRNLQREYNQLQQTGAATEKEQNTAMQKKTEKADQQLAAAQKEQEAAAQAQQKTEDYYNSSIKNLETQLKIQQLINEGKTEEAERLKIINDLESKGRPVEEARISRMMELKSMMGEQQLAAAQGTQAKSLYDRALLAAGRGQEADTRAALEQARAAKKGGELTEEEKSRTLELLGLSQQLDKLSGANFPGMAIQTNSLTARGGFQTGAVVPDTEKYNRIIADNGKTMLSVVQRIETICRQFGNF